MFSTPEAAEISAEYVAVRILGGRDLDEAGEAFMQRYGLQGYPSLLAVTAGGDLVDADLFDGQFRDAAFLLAALREAEEANEAFVAERARLRSKGDLESLKALAARYEERRNFDEVRALYEQILQEEGSREHYEKLLKVLQRTADTKAEHAHLEAMIATFPDDADGILWRMRLATVDLPLPTSPEEAEALVPRYVEALEVLRQEVAAEGDLADEAAVRVRMADLEGRFGDDEARQAHVAWILEKAVDTPAALDLKVMMAESALGRRDLETARESAEWVLARAPESLQAARAHMLLGDLAYGDHDFDAMAAHFEAVLRLAPDTSMARVARGALEAIQEIRERSERPPGPPSEGGGEPSAPSGR